MFDSKDLNYGFVILSPDANYGRIATTIRSIRAGHGDIPIVCAVTKDTDAKQIEQIKKICPVYKGKSHFTSLINIGMKNGHKEWNIIVIEGAIVPYKVIHKYSRFVEAETDILFPIMPDYDLNGKPIKLNSTFYDCSLNGLFIHFNTFKKIGNLTDNPLEISRVFWAYDAMSKGCQFKAILGIKIL